MLSFGGPLAVRLGYDQALLAAVAESLARALMQDMRASVKERRTTLIDNPKLPAPNGDAFMSEHPRCAQPRTCRSRLLSCLARHVLIGADSARYGHPIFHAEHLDPSKR